MNYVEPLTPREQEVFALVTQGYTNQEIAELLFISTNTVQNHVRSILGKLGVQSRIQALHKAYYFIPRDPDLFCEKPHSEKQQEHAVVPLPHRYSAHDG